MDPADSDTTPATFNEHLTFPFAGSDIAESLNYIPPQPRLVLKDRLYVGNLHPTVDECVYQILSFFNFTVSRYTLLQVFSKFGKITKLDFLFHKTGGLKGKPRGYAFIEYGEQTVSSALAPSR
jgi:RNA recognition motif-containing protein